MADNRPRFDALFADPRHYRGDCRMLRTAIRRGWLDRATQSERNALAERFEQATAAREAAGYSTKDQESRVMLATLRTVLTMAADEQRAERRALRFAWAGPAAPLTGRPRERWHVSDYPDRIDAHEVRRRAMSEGLDLCALAAVEVERGDGAGERVAVAVVADARYGRRVWLVCPGCRERRRHLYPVAAGARCRQCAGIAH